ncbi:hypothetical protein Taro_036237 [Colocasia esculenta]|uniref:Peptidase S8/S53 domain-containing protein n=1 Tax=Colocasia esculenta TaxID=4460 RepID=A0A843W7W4_COLES|nr:hypothetical protein [Colocasia esculenta]
MTMDLKTQETHYQELPGNDNQETTTSPALLLLPLAMAVPGRTPSQTPSSSQPDVIAPEVNILAAWTSFASPTDLDIDPRRVDFNIISSTSMFCPHASGLASLLRQAHSDWSPAAFKSALMTTAYNTDNSGGVIRDLANGKESTPFIRGAGHVVPNRSLDPGPHVLPLH